jgi:hypothetical protein
MSAQEFGAAWDSRWDMLLSGGDPVPLAIGVAR